jgi:hypothetical protein
VTFDQRIREEARLVLLRALADEPDRRLNSSLLGIALEHFGIQRSRDWVHDELRWLADMGVVGIETAGTVMIATLRQKGVDHVERRHVVTGIKRPSAEA